MGVRGSAKGCKEGVNTLCAEHGAPSAQLCNKYFDEYYHHKKLAYRRIVSEWDGMASRLRQKGRWSTLAYPSASVGT